MSDRVRPKRKRRQDEPGIEQAVGSAENSTSFTGAPDNVQHPGAGAGKMPDAADHGTTGMNTSTGRGRGSGVAGGVAGGHGGTVVSDTNRAVGHERDAGTTAGGVAVPFGRGSNLGGSDHGMASDIGGLSGGSLGGLRGDEVAGLDQEQQPGMGGDLALAPDDAALHAPGDAGGGAGQGPAYGVSPERRRESARGDASRAESTTEKD
ncbi:MAG: hypothetical protein RLZZ387_3256 [Chloroflexota bacterium]|jgi:hypothetical protein